MPTASLELLRERWCALHGADSDINPEGQPTDGFLAFVQIVDGICARYKFGAAAEKMVTAKEQAAFIGSLRLDDLLLARECAEGRPEAWERFMTLYRVTLYQAAYGITRSDSVGRELADSLYAELFGLNEKEGQQSRAALRRTIRAPCRATSAIRKVSPPRRPRRGCSG